MDLYNSDCLTIMPFLIDRGVTVDAIITDPPYLFDLVGVGGNSPISKRKKKVNKDITFMSGNFDYEKCFNLFLKLCPVANYLIFCSNKQISQTMSFFENKGLSATLLVWNKINAIPVCNYTYMPDLEFIIYVRGKVAFFNSALPSGFKHKIRDYPFVSPSERQHDAQKPLNLIKDLIELHTKPGDKILDCFMGSGTTGVACQQMKRDFIGIEIDEKYFEIAKKRIDDAGRQGSFDF